ncbi:MAG: RNA polymerase sigma factor [Bacteroidales bacterium]
MLGKLSDNDIIEGIRRQDEKVLNYLYDNYFKLVKNHVIKNKGNSDDVYDVFQDAIVLLYQKICENNFELTSELKGFFSALPVMSGTTSSGKSPKQKN